MCSGHLLGHRVLNIAKWLLRETPNSSGDIRDMVPEWRVVPLVYAYDVYVKGPGTPDTTGLVQAVRIMLLPLIMDAVGSGLITTAPQYIDLSTMTLGCGDGILFEGALWAMVGGRKRTTVAEMTGNIMNGFFP